MSRRNFFSATKGQREFKKFMELAHILGVHLISTAVILKL
jgi:hypothetical protein